MASKPIIRIRRRTRLALTPTPSRSIPPPSGAPHNKDGPCTAHPLDASTQYWPGFRLWPHSRVHCDPIPADNTAFSGITFCASRSCSVVVLMGGPKLFLQPVQFGFQPTNLLI